MSAHRLLRSVGYLAILVCNAPVAAASNISSPVIPQRFFVGSTIGDGVLKVALTPPRRMHVSGSGRLLFDRTLVLSQTVAIEDRPIRTREWHLREITPGHFEGTLTEASGPVTGEIVDGRLHLRYPMKGSVIADQWLTLEPDGRTAHNHMLISKFGIPVAKLDETIRRAP